MTKPRKETFASFQSGDISAVHRPTNCMGYAVAKIFLVEDNPDICDLVRLILTREGHSVDSFLSGRAAISTAPSLTPDLMLLDIHLPDVDGISLLARLRTVRGFEHIPAVALTADVRLDNRKRFEEAGFNLVIHKPILDLEEFSSTIRRMTAADAVA